MSKTDGDPEDQNDRPDIVAFHGPLTNWTPADTIAHQTNGILAKSVPDISDLWKIDLEVPCFTGSCAQDNVIPVEYQLDPVLEHRLFGCDL